MGWVQACVHCCPRRLGLQVGSWLPASVWVKNTYLDNSFRELVLFIRGGKGIYVPGERSWARFVWPFARAWVLEDASSAYSRAV